MARPRTFDRDVALEQAMHLFWERGYDRTSVSELTATMGIAPPSLYAAFGDKRRLFEEASERYQNDPGNFTRLALTEPTVRGSVARLLHDAAIEYTRARQPHGCMIINEPLLGERRARQWTELRDRIARGLGTGEIQGADPDQLADFVTIVLTGMSARARDGATTTELVQVADLALRAWPEQVSSS
ncbi:MAG: TetR/AcrR family transcriptional regulator [Propionibacteriales bacterium]|nr:TetR/AcrR family transcriptional regulator [Propionibacteriales bacterium]